jgi:hypothetical protein
MKGARRGYEPLSRDRPEGSRRREGGELREGILAARPFTRA